MYLHFYLRSGIVYIPTVGKMDKGLYRDIEPVTEVAVTDTKTLHNAISAALRSGNPDVPIPPRHRWPRPVVLKPAGTKSWSSFERGMRLWGIEERDGIFSIIGKMKKPDGTTVDDPKQTISFRNGTETEKIADRMVAILQKAVER